MTKSRQKACRSSRYVLVDWFHLNGVTTASLSLVPLVYSWACAFLDDEWHTACYII